MKKNEKRQLTAEEKDLLNWCEDKLRGYSSFFLGLLDDLDTIQRIETYPHVEFREESYSLGRSISVAYKLSPMVWSNDEAEESFHNELAEAYFGKDFTRKVTERQGRFKGDFLLLCFLECHRKHVKLSNIDAIRKIGPDHWGWGYFRLIHFFNINIKMHLEYASFRGAYLEDIDLSEAHLEHADLTGARLSRSSLDRANLKDAMLSSASLEETDLLDANIESANLHGAHLEGIDLSGSNLKHAKLHVAHLKQADLGNACLERAELFGADLEHANLENACLTHTNLNISKLKKANLRSATLDHSILTRASLRFTNLREASLVNVDLYGAHIEDADFTKANLNDASFKNCKLNLNTNFYACRTNSKTFFGNTDITLISNDEVRSKVTYSTRRMNWEIKYKSNKLKCLSPMRIFWQWSDYGYSTLRILLMFIACATLFASVYSYCAVSDMQQTGSSGIIANLIPDSMDFSVSDIGDRRLVIGRAIYFSIVTMTTLGFGDMYAQAGSFWGHFALCVQVIIGYVVLGALITRLSLLFTTSGPTYIPEKAPEHKREDFLLFWLPVLVLVAVTVFFTLASIFSK